MRIRVGTRGSALALAQAEAVAGALRALDHAVEIEVIRTAGDRDQTARYADIGAPGIFVREIETALIEGRVDAAVHSYKDLPSASAPGLVVAAVSERRDPADHLVAHRRAMVYRPHGAGASAPRVDAAVAEGSEQAGADRSPVARASLRGSWKPIAELPLIDGAVVGTSSARRAALLHALRPDLRIEPIRGNVPTRLSKLHEGPYDALVLAAAGLRRLEAAAAAPLLRDEWREVRLDPSVFVPAPAQGAIAIQCRAGDAAAAAVAPLHDEAAAPALRAERELLRLVDAGCDLPFGAWARTVGDDRLELHAVLGTPEGVQRARAHGTDPDEVAAAAWRKLEPRADRYARETGSGEPVGSVERGRRAPGGTG